MSPTNQQLPQLKQQSPHTSYTQVLLHDLSGSAQSVMNERQRDIVINAASEHVTNVSIGVVNAGGGSAQNARKNIGVKIGKLERGDQRWQPRRPRWPSFLLQSKPAIKNA